MSRPTDFAAFASMAILAAAGGVSAAGFGIAFLATGSPSCAALCAASAAVAALGAYRAWQSDR